jgi:hydrogenase maturation protease
VSAVIIGVGNVVLGDDGLGVHAVRRLRERHALPGVELVEGGTAGLLLLGHFAASRPTFVVDAVDADAPPGTLVRLEGAECERALVTGRTVHDVGLADLLAAALITGAWPQRLVLHGVQPGSMAVGTELSPAVAAALDRLVDRIAIEVGAASPAR